MVIYIPFSFSLHNKSNNNDSSTGHKFLLYN